MATAMPACRTASGLELRQEVGGIEALLSIAGGSSASPAEAALTATLGSRRPGSRRPCGRVDADRRMSQSARIVFREIEVW